MNKVFAYILSLMSLFAYATPSFAQPFQGGASSYVGADVARIEEEIRKLRGDNERLQHEVNQLKEAQRRFQEDIEFRLNGNAPTPMGGAPTPPLPSQPSMMPPTTNMGHLPTLAPPPPMPNAVAIPANSDAGIVPLAQTEEETPAPPAIADPQTLRHPSEEGVTPRELYNQAFRLLNQTDYDGAEKAFARFIEDFSGDPLIGNAWYWMGETFYVRREYVRAADSFRQGFGAMEEGPKAGDNLLKLAMSLAAMEKDQEACVVLKQVDSKYADNSSTLKNKTKNEINRLGC